MRFGWCRRLSAASVLANAALVSAPGGCVACGRCAPEVPPQRLNVAAERSDGLLAEVDRAPESPCRLQVRRSRHYRSRLVLPSAQVSAALYLPSLSSLD